MYTPDRFKEPDEAFLFDFITKESFATLVSSRDDRPIATHIPLDLHRDEAGRPVLIGHMARANEQWRTLSAEHEVLAIFMGPHTYISPRWYDHPNVPTWNYLAVHVYGRPAVVTEPAQIRMLVDRQVGKYETDPAQPYRTEDLPRDLLERDLRGIVAFTIAVTRVEASAKLSQNRDERDFRNIIAELEKRGDSGSRAIAQLMRERYPYAG